MIRSVRVRDRARVIVQGMVARLVLRILWRRRLNWMIALAILLLVSAGLFLLAQSSPHAPFIYTLF